MTHLRSTVNPPTPRPGVVGVLNVTPDSFYDGGQWLVPEKALRYALRMVTEGAVIIDIGGESTRPGAIAVSLNEELDRVIPIIECIAKECDVPLSIDSYKPAVMLQAIKSGARMINDVKALLEPGALEVASQTKVQVCLMHLRGEPTSMQQSPVYAQDIIAEIHHFFVERIRCCIEAGIDKSQIIIDPGFGFGKKTQHNMRLINQLSQFCDLGVDILVGASRKASIGEILNVGVDQRLVGSLALAVLAVNNGAKYIRTHDVKATVQALTMAWAVHNEIEVIQINE